MSMEVRIAKIEKELALMSSSLGMISKILEKMSNVPTDTRVIEEKLIYMDKELQESFARVHKRIDEEAQTRIWLTRVIIGGLLIAGVSFIVKGGLA